MHSASGSPRAFAWLNATQFLGALNDNLFKLLLIFFLIALKGTAAAGGIAALAGAIFVVPFLLFSIPAGVLVDRVGKSRIIVAAKGLEVAIMLLGAAAFWQQSATGLYLALFLMALQSTLFSPAKYGIVPELVPREGLSRANGLLEALTYLAIILGTALATFLPYLAGGRYELVALACPALALLGLAASFGIGSSAAPAAGGVEGAGGDDFRGSLALLRRDGYLALAVLGSAAFMLFGAFVQLNLIPLGLQELGLSQELSGGLFLLAALGIGLGSLAAGRLSGRNVELGVVPLGALLLALAALLLGRPGLHVAPFLAAVFALGIGAGLYIVPLHAFIQFRSPPAHRGKILAAGNFLSWWGVLAAALLTHLVNESLTMPARFGFTSLAVLAAILTVVTLVILPDFLLRFLALIMVRLVYRVRVKGGGHVPVEGGALLVANHVSWIDALLLVATQQRRIRFLMERRLFAIPLLQQVCRLMGVIPISAADGRREIGEALNLARRALDEGYLVCIFAEGAISRNGTLQEFRPGFERIVQGSSHPIIPVHIGGVWGSIFSYPRPPLGTALLSPLSGQVLVGFGAPLPASTAASEVRQAVMELSCDYFAWRKQGRRSLGHRFVATARRHWRRPAVADTGGQSLTYGATLTGALALQEALAPRLAGEQMVAVLLPPSVGCALANLSLTLSGKVPVNLNYSASADALRSAIRQADLQTVLTSRKFLAKLGEAPLPPKAIFLEDILPALGRRRKLIALLKARLLPIPVLLHHLPADADALATVIFSSGSTGEPKGVMLSQHNILSNIEALRMVFAVDGRDKICGVLPLFHSFGYTGTFWLPLLSGFSAVYHPNPLDTGKVVAMVREHRCTFLLTTPTFLSSYLRKAEVEDFASLRVVITGAEKLRPSLAQAFAEKFAIAPLEGYGATELSPVAALNLPEVPGGKVRQPGSLPESVGRPLPGVAVRIVSPETGVAQPPEEPGMILFRGPNVMRGYLKEAEKTAAVLREGWYVSGDIGFLDPRGFLHITGRLSRFSKIGGEMVSHGAIEEILQQGIGSIEPLLSVTAVADPRKGERLVVLHTPAAGSAARLQAIIAGSALPNLWKPAPACYLEVEALPLLGSGKLDLQELRRLAEEKVSPQVA